VFRHDYVSHYHKVVRQASFFEDGQEQSTTSGCIQEWAALIAAARNEMEVVRTVISRQTGRHRYENSRGNRPSCLDERIFVNAVSF